MQKQLSYDHDPSSKKRKMVTKKQVLLIITLTVIIKLSFIFPTSLSEVLSQDDSAAMAELAGVLNPRPPDWSSSPTNSSNYCHWQRVACDGSGGVTLLDLDSMNLTGSLPRRFPPLPLLGILSLSNNNLSGPMPGLHSLTSLQSLSLEVNSFTTITMEFFEGLAPSLEYLYISFNPSLAPWRIPVQLSRLVNLKEFTALDTNLSGTLPDIFQSFPLDYLHLDGNNLVGSLPPSMARSKLSRLMLYNQATGLSGSIEVLSRIPFLRFASLGNNKFTGPIPDFSNCKALEFLELSNNELAGVVPRSLESLAGLSNLDLSNNRLQGPFPSFLLKKQVVLDNNTFCTTTGNPCDSQVTTLLQIAADLGYPLKLSESWTGNDACSNKWPFVICNSQKQIVGIDLHNQSFNGTISPALAELKMLQNVHLNDNNLTSSIPHSLTGLQHLRVIDVSNNGLSGKVPPFRTSVLLNITGNPALLRSEGSSTSTGKQSEKRRRMKLVLTLLLAIMSSITAGICICFIRSVIARLKDHEHHNGILEKGEVHLKLQEILFVGRKKQWIIAQEIQSFKFQRLAAATNNFDLKKNKIGEGGFGPVYKGELQDGQEIAVKRLSNRSGQGTGEFVNEVKVISKIQHKNLVKLLGFCVSKEEKMLVYEYMPNMSLDAYLFDPEKQGVLDWRKRFNIIQGIGLGLLYLHRDSRPRIIHRDLKASNVLLDEDWNPKISDFGMARIFGTNEDQANTRRIVGTFGYMPREYAMEGRFSEKSDVFSFGVLVLEIISGRRNTSFHGDDDSLNLLEHAWKLWNRAEILSLIDPTIYDPGFYEEILRCTHVGLLCVQDFVKDRPSMSLVISMLGSELHNLPTPNPPMFLEPEALLEHYKRSLNQSCSINNVTVSEVGPR